MSVSPQQLKIRRIVWTVAISAVTAMGAWYGAGLKVQSDFKKEVKKQREASPIDMIKVLEEKRSGLIGKKMGLEKKIKEIEMRAAGATREESMQGQERKRPG